MPDRLYNNFTAGQVSQKLGGRTDLAAYQNGAREVLNLRPFLQGGYTRRPGLEDVAALDGAIDIVPFVYTSGLSFFVAFFDGAIDVLYSDGTSAIAQRFTTDSFTRAQIPTICTTQDSSTLYITQADHWPMMLTYNGTSFSYSRLTPLCMYKHVRYANSTKFYRHVAYAMSADGTSGFSFADDGQLYTGVYYSSSESQSGEPAKYTWYPYAGAEPSNIKPDIEMNTNSGTYVGVLYTNSADDASDDPKDYYWQKYEEHLNYGEDNAGLTLEISSTNGNYPCYCWYHQNRLWLLSSYAHPYRMWISRPYNPSDFRTYNVQVTISETATADAYAEAIANGTDVNTTTSRVLTEVYEEDCALVMEIGGNRNDRLLWAGAAGSRIVVGTASSEWAIDGPLGAVTNNGFTQRSAYGSASLPIIQANDKILFMQSGARVLRSYSFGQYGQTESENLVFYADDILKSGVRKFAWQRVPDPTLYCVLRDGTMAVLCLDDTYRMKAWAKWTTKDGFESVCVLDSSDGQDVYVLSGGKVKRFVEGSLSETFTSRLVTERIDAGSTIGRHKRVSQIRLRVLDSDNFTVGYAGGKKQENRESIDEGEVVLKPMGGWEQDLRLAIEASGANRLTVLAMVLEMEATT